MPRNALGDFGLLPTDDTSGLFDMVQTIPDNSFDFSSVITDLPDNGDLNALTSMIPPAPSSPSVFSQIGNAISGLFKSTTPTVTTTTIPRVPTVAVPQPALLGLTVTEWEYIAGGLVVLLIVASLASGGRR